MVRLERVIDNNHILILKKEKRKIPSRMLVIRCTLVKPGRVLGCPDVSSEWLGVNLAIRPQGALTRVSEGCSWSDICTVWSLRHTAVTWLNDLVGKQSDGGFDCARVTRLFSTELLLNKIWNTTVSLFSCLNEFQTVCRVWELPKQRGGVTVTSQPLFGRMLGCPNITDCPLPSESHQAILPSRREDMARPVLCQTSRAYRVDLDFLLTKKFSLFLFFFLFLFLIHLNPSILILLFFLLLHSDLLQTKKPWCFFGKEFLLIVNWLRVVNSQRSLEFWVQPSE